MNDKLFNWLLPPASTKDGRIDLALGLRSKGAESVLTAVFREDILALSAVVAGEDFSTKVAGAGTSSPKELKFSFKI